MALVALEAGLTLLDYSTGVCKFHWCVCILITSNLFWSFAHVHFSSTSGLWPLTLKQECQIIFPHPRDEANERMLYLQSLCTFLFMSLLSPQRLPLFSPLFSFLASYWNMGGMIRRWKPPVTSLPCHCPRETFARSLQCHKLHRTKYPFAWLRPRSCSA